MTMTITSVEREGKGSYDYIVKVQVIHYFTRVIFNTFYVVKLFFYYTLYFNVGRRVTFKFSSAP